MNSTQARSHSGVRGSADVGESVRLGEGIAAGSVVIRDVPDFAFVAGVPAKRIGWVGRADAPLKAVDGGYWECPRTGENYLEDSGVITLLASEHSPSESKLFPEELST